MGNCMAKNPNPQLRMPSQRDEVQIAAQINQEQCKYSSVICQPESQIRASSPLQQCPKQSQNKIEQKDNNSAQQNNKKNSPLLQNCELIISKYKWNKIEAQIDSLQNKYDCKIIQSAMKDQNQGESQIANLTFNDKELLLIHGDIINQRCNAIINPCINKQLLSNSNELSGVAKVVAQFAGTDYQNHLKKSKFLNQKQIQADLFTTQNDNFSHIISIPIQNCQQVNQDLDQFPLHIQNIFKIVQDKKIQSIAMPIYCGGFNFQTASEIIIAEMIKQLSNQNILKRVAIVEINHDNAQQMLKVLKNLLYPPPITRQVVYQWQWECLGVWKDYDYGDMNQQIDEAYEIYQQDKNRNEVQLLFPYSQLPGTHEVDLNKMVLKDRSTGEEQKITIIGHQYYFQNQIVTGSLNEYLHKQQQSNMVFQIFNKSHKIVFNTNGSIIQANTCSNYTRSVRFVPKNQHIKANKLNLDIFEFNEQVYNRPINNVNISIIYTKQNNLNKLQQNMKNIFKENDGIEIEWKVLNLLEQDLNDVSQFLTLYCKKIDGQIQYGNIIKIHCTSESCSVINKYLENVKSKVIYPETWIPQTKNCIKVELATNNQEYIMVSDLFKKTLSSTIYRIMRIQNLQLYQNFNYDRKVLIQNRSNQLQFQERERYVWHGVRNSNPKLIYEGTKEGFDSTFSNDGCMWGKGIYFAENASYSLSYAYSLNSNDDLQYEGKQVFLLCLVCTGKIKILSEDSTLKRAPDGYDCVQGSTRGSDVFILYGMDVRRAYPAYEIVFG